MKVTLIQPYFPDKMEGAEKSFCDLCTLLDKCDKTSDIIVLPEYCDVPINTSDNNDFLTCIEKYNEKIIKKATETAIRCNSLVFINCASIDDNMLRNTTYAINRKGEIVGKYFKSHLAPSEYDKFDFSYRKLKYEPYVLEIEGVRYGFLTCYDFYFYEDYIELARQNVDVIIGCSHQRTDTHEALSIFGKFLSYNTNAYLLRASISLGEDKKVCGCSMVVAPNGDMLLDMKSRIGLDSVDIDVTKKYYKPAGYLGKPKSHYEYVDDGRKYLENTKK